MTERVWFDGRASSPPRPRAVGLLTHSLHYGTAVFDGGRHYRLVADGVGVFRLDDHVRRSFASAASLWMSLPWGAEQLNDRRHARGRARQRPRRRLRPPARLLRRSADRPRRAQPGPRGRPRVGARQLARRRHPCVRIASFGHGGGWIPTAKHAGHYGRAFLALREAEASGHDDALFLGDDGSVVEATGANLFIVRGGRLVTPPDQLSRCCRASPAPACSPSPPTSRSPRSRHRSRGTTCSAPTRSSSPTAPPSCAPSSSSRAGGSPRPAPSPRASPRPTAPPCAAPIRTVAAGSPAWRTSR